MSERPSELDLMLDAIDDAFKSEITQFAKDVAVALQQQPKEQESELAKIVENIALVRVARSTMIAKVSKIAGEPIQ